MDDKNRLEFEKIIKETKISSEYKQNLIGSLRDIDLFITDQLYYLGMLKGKITAFWFMDKISNKQKEELWELIKGFEVKFRK